MLTLIVEDNRNSAEIVASILRSIGAEQIRYSTNEEDAFRALGEEHFDLVVVDQNLGKGSEGIDLVRRIRTDPESSNCFVPILMLTAYTQRHRVLAARDAGINEFLMKPFTAKELVLRLESLLSKPRDFVRSETYFGPDRRRFADASYKGPERRSGADRTPGR